MFIFILPDFVRSFKRNSFSQSLMRFIVSQLAAGRVQCIARVFRREMRLWKSAVAQEETPPPPAKQQADGAAEQKQQEEASSSATKPIDTTLNARHRIIAEGGVPPLQYDFEREKWAQAERFGQYGLKSGVDIRTLWPSIEEIEEIQALRMCRTAKDAALIAQKNAEAVKARHKKKMDAIERNWESYDKKVAEFEQRVIEVKEEKATKEHELERMIKEVQDYFGYWVDPKDPRFSLMLREREAMAKEEERRKRKQKRKQAILKAEELPKVEKQRKSEQNKAEKKREKREAAKLGESGDKSHAADDD